MTPIKVSAPGKAIVSGEYAVLGGAPAISMALDRRATVRIKAAADAYHQVSTPGYREGEWRFRAADGGRLEWRDRPPATGLGLVEAAWARAACDKLEPLAITVDTTAFSDNQSGCKLGLGSSAAAMTALVVALCQFRDQKDFPAGALAYRAHADLQGGLGSGVDISTSLRGGVIEYQMNENAEALHRSWPDKLLYSIVWSGRPASTASRLNTLNTRRPTDRTWAPFIDSAINFAAAWVHGDAEKILESIRSYTSSLYHFSEANELDIFEGGHDNIYTMSDDHDVVYKPCGAGGGDIGIVLGTSRAAVASFCEAAGDHGFAELSARLDPTGVSISNGEQQ